MIAKSKYSFIFIRTGMLLISLLANISFVLAQQNLIISQPKSQVKCKSEGYATLSLEASGTLIDGYHFQWRQWNGTNFVNIPTAGNGPEYTVQLTSLVPPVVLKYDC